MTTEHNLSDSRILRYADNIRRQAYYKDVASIAQECIDEIKTGNLANPDAVSEWLEETIDGHERIIYYHKAKDTLRWVDNGDAAFDELGNDCLAGKDSLGSIECFLVLFAMMADVRDKLDDLGYDGTDESIARLRGEPADEPT